MSELINNSKYRKEKLKELILKLHEGADPAKVREELINTLKHIPYGEVVEVEQELISEGLPETEVLKLCDVHGEVLEGHVDQSGAKEIPEGHPVDVFVQENRELKKGTTKVRELLGESASNWTTALSIEMGYTIEGRNIQCDLLLLFTEDSTRRLNELVAYMAD